jgi:NAD(P)-dependent dehydrogenase (short-subunit alcohol dehydrogenase family)
METDAFDAFNLEGRVAVITGVAWGIGRGAAMLFAQAGAGLVLAGIDGAGWWQRSRP